MKLADGSNEIPVAIAVIQEQLKSLIKDSEDARHARKNSYMAQEKRDEMLIRIEHRLENVELFIKGASPTLQEFNALKLKAQGAGVLGGWLWAIAGVSIGIAASLSGVIGRIMEGFK